MSVNVAHHHHGEPAGGPIRDGVRCRPCRQGNAARRSLLSFRISVDSQVQAKYFFHDQVCRRPLWVWINCTQ
jgi:hypothetical protein